MDHFRATLPVFWVSLPRYLRGPDQLLLTFISLPIKGEINQESPHNLLRDAGNTHAYAHAHKHRRGEEAGHTWVQMSTRPGLAWVRRCRPSVRPRTRASSTAGGEKTLWMCTCVCVCLRVCVSDSAAVRLSGSV